MPERVREARPFRDEPPAPPSESPAETPDPEVVAAKQEQANQVITRSSAPSTASSTPSAATTSRRYPARSTCGRHGQWNTRDLRGQDDHAANELSQT